MHFRKRRGNINIAELIERMNVAPWNVTCKNNSVRKFRGLFFQGLQSKSIAYEQNFYMLIFLNHAQTNVQQFFHALFVDHAPQKQKHDIAFFYSPFFAHRLNFFLRNRVPQKSLAVERIRNYRRRTLRKHKRQLEIFMRFLRNIDERVEIAVHPAHDSANQFDRNEFSTPKIIFVEILPQCVRRGDGRNPEFLARKFRRLSDRKFSMRMNELHIVFLQKSN